MAIEIISRSNLYERYMARPEDRNSRPEYLSKGASDWPSGNASLWPVHLTSTTFNEFVRKNSSVPKLVLKWIKSSVSQLQHIFYFLVANSSQIQTANFKTAMSLSQNSIVRFFNLILENQQQNILSHRYMLWRRGIGGRETALEKE